MTVKEHTILAIAARHYRYPAVRETHIRHELNMTETRYYQTLNNLINRPDVEATYPTLTRRLQRIRDTRKHARTFRHQ